MLRTPPALGLQMTWQPEKEPQTPHHKEEEEKESNVHTAIANRRMYSTRATPSVSNSLLAPLRICPIKEPSCKAIRHESPELLRLNPRDQLRISCDKHLHSHNKFLRNSSSQQGYRTPSLPGPKWGSLSSLPSSHQTLISSSLAKGAHQVAL